MRFYRDRDTGSVIATDREQEPPEDAEEFEFHAGRWGIYKGPVSARLVPQATHTDPSERAYAGAGGAPYPDRQT